MPKRIPLSIGQKFGRWEVVGSEFKKSSLDLCWRVPVRCSCGFESVVIRGELINKRSNGCINCANKSRSSHNLSNAPEYWVWRAMLKRCYDSNNVGYFDYGARGVMVCDRWNPREGGSFENFYADMGPRPGAGYELDKEAFLLDNKIYAPGLVKWVTKTENLNRTRKSRFVDFCGKKITIANLSKKTGISYRVLYYQIITKGMPVAEVLNNFECKIND